MLSQEICNFSDPEKKLYLQSIVSVAESDGEISEPEREFIKLQAKFLGLENYLEILEELKIEKIKNKEISKELARLIIRDCIFLSHLDRDYSIEEKEKIRQLARSMGLNEIDVILAEEYMENYINSIEDNSFFLNYEENQFVILKVDGSPPIKDPAKSLWLSQQDRVKALAKSAQQAMNGRKPFEKHVKLKMFLKLYRSPTSRGDLMNKVNGITDVLQGWRKSINHPPYPKDLPEVEKPIVYEDDSQIVQVICNEQEISDSDNEKEFYIVSIRPL